MHYAGFWRRLGALSIDCLIILIVGSPFWLAGLYCLIQGWPALYMAPSTLFLLGYYVLVPVRLGATPGKWLFKTRITLADGASLSARAAFLRYLPWWLLSIASTVPVSWMVWQGAWLPQPEQGILVNLVMMAGLKHDSAWQKGYELVLVFWVLASALVFWRNRQKRTLHDLLAGTVVQRRGLPEAAPS